MRGRAAKTGYDRAQYGQAWLDTDRNGCDTRNDTLRRDLSQTVVRAGTNGCLVESGVLHDPYTARDLQFTRGPGDVVDIDHVVALENSWVTGASLWDIRKRAALANDPMNLLAVDASANRQKGAGDAATWLPSNKRYRCAYVARQLGVKAKYGLVGDSRRTCCDRTRPLPVPGRTPADGLRRPGAVSVAVNAPHISSAPTPSGPGSVRVRELRRRPRRGCRAGTPRPARLRSRS